VFSSQPQWHATLFQHGRLQPNCSFGGAAQPYDSPNASPAPTKHGDASPRRSQRPILSGPSPAGRRQRSR
jgi:hypothetical protein